MTSASGSTPLPAIGRPATAALLAEGVSTLEQVAGRTRPSLAALHGVGPKALDLLALALAAKGMSFRDEPVRAVGPTSTPRGSRPRARGS